MGETLYSGVGIYGDGDGGKLYYVPPNQNSDNAPPRSECKILTGQNAVPGSLGCRAQEEQGVWIERGNSKIYRDTSKRDRGWEECGGRDRKGGVIRNISMTGGNTRRKWGNV